MRFVYFFNGGLWFVQSWAWLKYSDSLTGCIVAVAVGAICLAYAKQLDTYVWRAT